MVTIHVPFPLKSVTTFVKPWFTLETMYPISVGGCLKTSLHFGQDVILFSVTDLRRYTHFLSQPTAVAFCRPPTPQNRVTIFHGWTNCLSLLPSGHELQRSYYFQHYCKYKLNLRILCLSYIATYLPCLKTCSDIVRNILYNWFSLQNKQQDTNTRENIKCFHCKHGSNMYSIPSCPGLP
jgi:hypothetical protein